MSILQVILAKRSCTAVSALENNGRMPSRGWWALVEVASLIFVAEWGDRSMLATIALGAAQSPAGRSNQ
jgi:putative Ca2+/H+ antiporter (TMEM165/GDT1 family)